MRNALALLILCLSSSLALADVTGSWNGWLDWSFDGSPTRCDSMMKFKQTDQSLDRVSGSLICDVVTMEIDPKSWILKEGQILEGDVVVGSFSPDDYQWTEDYSSTVKIETHIKVSGQHLDYSEVWKKKADQSEIYVIKGRLFLAP